MGFETTWSSNWSGASGQQIGYAGDEPVTTGQGFTADDVHGQAFNPNGHNFAAQPGPTIDVPVEIQGAMEFGQFDGGDGWLLDSIQYPSYGEDAGTVGHDASVDAARAQRRDPGHGVDVYQDDVPQGHGVNFYGAGINMQDVNAWNSSTGRNPNSGQYPAQAREDAGNWPVPFAVQNIGVDRPVVIAQDRIPMRRLTEDDRPIYQYQAVPAANIKPGQYQFLPTVDSNRALRTIVPTPQMARTPIDPWVSEYDDSAEMYPDYQDVFGGELG